MLFLVLLLILFLCLLLQINITYTVFFYTYIKITLWLKHLVTVLCVYSFKLVTTNGFITTIYL